MSAHIHKYTCIHTCIQNVHMNARKARLKRRRGSHCASSPTWLCPSPCPPHDSAPSRPHPLICTGAKPIHPVHCPRQLPAWPWPPETRSFFCHFGGVFNISYVNRDIKSNVLVVCAWFPLVTLDVFLQRDPPSTPETQSGTLIDNCFYYL